MTVFAVSARLSSRRAVLMSLAGGGAMLGLAACAPKLPVDAPPASVVFFTAYSADLDANAQQAIQHIAADAKASPRRAVIVEGYADAVGSPASNRTLSQLRAQVVADALVAQGIDRSRLRVRPRGATGGDPGVESRRVDVSFGS